MLQTWPSPKIQAPTRVNISLPEQVLQQIDELAFLLNTKGVGLNPNRRAQPPKVTRSSVVRVALDALLDVRLDLRPLQHFALEFRIEPGEAVPPGPLGGVHGDIALAENVDRTHFALEVGEAETLDDIALRTESNLDRSYANRAIVRVGLGLKEGPTLREFGVSVYAQEDGPKNGDYAPSFHIIDHIIYHTSLDVPELVPATGLERATRAFVAALDRAQHPELTRPLEDGEHERVHHPEEADDHGEREEDALEEAMERVDPDVLLISELGLEEDEEDLELTLDLLADVPAGKLVIVLRRGSRTPPRVLRRATRASRCRRN